jgi:hypothetical protein
VKRLVCALLLSCGPVDVVVADVPKACSETSPCGTGEFCEYRFCDPNDGICRPMMMCNGTDLPECGCDGVRYANACAREAAGQSRGPDPCQ